MPCSPEDLLDRVAILRGHVGEQQTLMRRQPDARREPRADFAERGLQSDMLVVEDATVLDVQAVEPAAIPLLVPAQVIVEAVYIVGLRAGQAARRSTLRPWP